MVNSYKDEKSTETTKQITENDIENYDTEQKLKGIIILKANNNIYKDNKLLNIKNFHYDIITKLICFNNSEEIVQVNLEELLKDINWKASSDATALVERLYNELTEIEAVNIYK